MESILKKIRIAQCLSQEELASLSNISIKTIQRIESGKSTGSAYSIKQLAGALNIEAIQLRNKDRDLSFREQDPLSIVKQMNWSTLMVIILPFANIIFPLMIFKNHKDHSSVSTLGRKVISVQILWTFVTLILATLLPLLCLMFMDQPYSGSVPLFIPVYLFAVLLNVFVILTIAFLLSNKNESDYWLPNLL